MNSKQRICVLFSGIDKLSGLTAVKFMKDFNLKEYGGVSSQSVGKFWYSDFSLEVNDNYNILKTITELLIWLGRRKITFRFNESRLSDSQVDFQLHIIEENVTWAMIPKPRYIGRR